MSRARDALECMRRSVGLSMAANIDEYESQTHLRNAARWAQVFMAESLATQYANATRERIQNDG